MIFLINIDIKEKKKKKKINEIFVENIRHKEYIDVFFNQKIIRHKMNRIQNKLQRITTKNV